MADAGRDRYGRPATALDPHGRYQWALHVRFPGRPNWRLAGRYKTLAEVLSEESRCLQETRCTGVEFKVVDLIGLP